MGAAVVKSDKKATLKSKQIDQEIRKERTILRVKIILLGSAESGKSTLVRQMKVLKRNGFSETEKRFFKQNIRLNAIFELAKLSCLIEKELPTVYNDYCESFYRVDTWCEDYSVHWGELDPDLSSPLLQMLMSTEVVDLLVQNPHFCLTHIHDFA